MTEKDEFLQFESLSNVIELASFLVPGVWGRLESFSHFLDTQKFRIQAVHFLVACSNIFSTLDSFNSFPHVNLWSEVCFEINEVPQD